MVLPLPFVVLARLPMVSMLFVPLSVIVWSAAMLTAPVPRFRLFVPPKVKLPPKVITLLLARVSEPPVVLSIVPPLMTKAPGPGAFGFLIFGVTAAWVAPAAIGVRTAQHERTCIP